MSQYYYEKAQEQTMDHYIVTFGQRSIEDGIVMGVKEAKTPQDAIVQCATDALADSLGEEFNDEALVSMAEWVLNGAVSDDVGEEEQKARMQSVVQPALEPNYNKEENEHHYQAMLLQSNDNDDVPAVFNADEMVF